jgi:hypothetical protein
MAVNQVTAVEAGLAGEICPIRKNRIDETEEIRYPTSQPVRHLPAVLRVEPSTGWACKASK